MEQSTSQTALRTCDDSHLQLLDLDFELVLHILEFCDWPTRVRLLSTARHLWQWACSLKGWLWMCAVLERQDLAYVDTGEAQTADAVFAAFLDAYKRRSRWTLLAVHRPSGSSESGHPQSPLDLHPPAVDGEAEINGDGAADEAVTAESFSISVTARFRPLPSAEEMQEMHRLLQQQQRAAAADSADDQGDEETDEQRRAREELERFDAGADDVDGALARDYEDVVVPLHQRLQMIMAQHRCTHSEARRLLWAGHTGQLAHPLDNVRIFAKSLPSASQDKENISGEAVHDAGVQVCDGQPQAEAQRTSLSDSATVDADGTDDDDAAAAALPHRVKIGVLAVEPATRKTLMCAPSVGLRSFKFDCVLDSVATQSHTFEVAAKPLVNEFINGSNCCIFCYGQTGSGKTHTMFGPDLAAGSAVTKPQESSGLVPRVISAVTRALGSRERRSHLKVTLHMAAVEIFGEQLTDLLSADRRTLGVQRLGARVLRRGDASVEVTSAEQAEQLLRMAESNKRQAATAMNKRSTRAHTVVLLKLTQAQPANGASVVSTLCLADLGGSEQQKKSRAEGERLQEAKQINLGLLALKKCISALLKRYRHVPFQSTALTYALQDALTGSCHTSVVVTASLENQHATETYQTLRFGELCSRVQMGGAMGPDVTIATDVIRDINSELERLEKQIRAEERWVNKTEVRQDAEGAETVVTSVLVGAEHLRERYEQLLATRRELVGI